MALRPSVTTPMQIPFEAEAGRFTTELQTNRIQESPFTSEWEKTRLSTHSPTQLGQLITRGPAANPRSKSDLISPKTRNSLQEFVH